MLVRTRTAAVCTAALLGLAACGSSEGAPGGAQADPDPPTTPAPAPSPAPTPAPPGPADPVPGPRDCDTDEADAMAATVSAQLDALATGDFLEAHGWATLPFRALVNVTAFEELIRTGYPELLDVATRRFEACRLLGRRALLRVVITAGSGAERVLGYELVEERDDWRIDGAQDLEPPRPAPVAPTV